MAKTYNLTMQLNLQGPSNLRSVAGNIKKQLSSVGNNNLNINIDKRSLASIDAATQKLRAMTSVLQQSRAAAASLNSSLGKLGGSFRTLQNRTTKANSTWQRLNKNLQATNKNLKQTTSSSNKLGQSLKKQLKSIASYSIINQTIGSISGAISESIRSFIEFERNLNRVQQITNVSAGSISNLSQVIRELGVSLGVSSSEIAQVAVTFTQAGLRAQEVETALKAVAQASLAPTFSSMGDAAEGAIAVFRQFEISADQLESTFDSINAVAGKFAVEFDDIVSAIQRGGGAFAAASKGIDTGAESLNKFIALFTTARATTRESAETISTGIRTITARLQRLGTQVAIENLIGVELSDNGQFVGVYKAIELISQRIKELGLRTQDVKFAQLVEELGGIRQISRVIPLLTEFGVAQEALNTAQNASGSTSKAAAGAQQTLQVQLQKTLEAWNDLVAAFSNNSALKGTFGFILQLTRGFLNFAKAFEPFLPILTALAGVKIAKGLGSLFGGGGGGGLKGMLGGGGKSQQAVIQATTQQTTATNQQTAATNNQLTAVQTNTLALNTLTNAVVGLANTFGQGGSAVATGNSGGGGGGGSSLTFARGGVVPGTGNRDTVPAMLTPGEFVIRKNAVAAIGADKLHSMNKYADGGRILKEDSVGGMALIGNANYIEDDISKKDVIAATPADYKEKVKTAFGKGSKTWKLDRQRPSDEYKDKLKTNIEDGVIAGTNNAVSNFASTLGITSTAIDTTTDELKKNFLSSVNDASIGNVFEQVISSLSKGGQFTDAEDPRRPFDFTNGIPSNLQKSGLWDKINSDFVETKANISKTTSGIISGKVAQLIYQDNESFPGTSDYTTPDNNPVSRAFSRINSSLGSDVSVGSVVSNKSVAAATGASKDLLEAEAEGYISKVYYKKDGKFVNFGEGEEYTLTGKEDPSSLAGKGYGWKVNKLIQEKAQGGFIQKLMAGGYSKPVSPKQLAFLKSLVEKSGVPEGFEYPPKTSAQASALIDRIKNPPKQGLDLNGLFNEYQQIFGIAHPQSKEELEEEEIASWTQNIDRTIDKYNKFANVIKEYYGKIIQQDSWNGGFYALGGPNPRMPKRAELDQFVQGGGFDRKLLEEFATRGDAAFGASVNAPRGRSANSSALRTRKTYMRGYAEGGAAEDTVPALLTPGEFVINKKAAARIGSSNLERLNRADKVQGFNKGGIVGGGIQRLGIGGFSIGNFLGGAKDKISDLYSKVDKEGAISNTGSALLAGAYSLGSGGIGALEGALKQSYKAAKDTNLLGNIKGLGSEIRKGIAPTIAEMAEFDKTGKNNSDILGAALKTSGSLVKTAGLGTLGAVFGGLEGVARGGVESGLLGKTAKAGTSIGKAAIGIGSSVGKNVLSAGASFGQKALSAGKEHGDGALLIGSFLGQKAMSTGQGLAKSGYSALTSLFKKKAQGGSIEDSVPALLTPGEFVINKKAAARIGSSNLERMNAQGFNKGGSVGFVQKFAIGGEAEAVKIIEKIAESAGRTAAQVAQRLAKEYMTGDNSIQGLEAKGYSKGDVARGTVQYLSDALNKFSSDSKENQQLLKAFTGSKFGISALGAREGDIYSDKEAGVLQNAILDAIIKINEEARAATEAMLKAADSTEKTTAETAKVTAAVEKQVAETEKVVSSLEDLPDKIEVDDKAKPVGGAATGGVVSKTGRTAALVAAAQKGGKAGLLGGTQKILSGVAGKIGGIYTMAAGKVAEIWQKGGEAVAGVITKVSLSLGAALGALENSIDLSENEGLAAGFGAAKGGLAGAATGAQLAKSLGLGPAGTLITAGSLAIVGALKGAATAIQKVRLDKIIKSIGEATIDLKKGFEALENNVDGGKEQIVDAFSKQLKASDQLLKISQGGTFAERQYTRFIQPVFGGETAVDKNRLGGANAALDAIYGPSNVSDQARTTAKKVERASFFSGIFSPITTAVDVLVDYLATNSEAVLRARDAFAEGGGKRFESAIEFARIQGTRAADENLATESSIGNLYFQSLKQQEEEALQEGQTLSDVRIRQIKKEANDQAAIDAAFARAAEIGGGAVDQLTIKLNNHREAVIADGNAIIENQQKIINAQIAQERASKAAQIAIANQTDIYRNFVATLQRVNTELSRADVLLDEFISFDQGATIDRSNEEVIGNLLAYTPEEVRSATAPVITALGGGDQAVELQQNLATVKFLETELPALLRNAQGNPEAGRQVVEQLRGQLEAQGITGTSVDEIIKQIAEKIEEQPLGTVLEEIDFGGIITKFSSAAEEGQKALLEATKTYNNQLQRSIDLQNKFNASLNKAADYFLRASQIQAESVVRFNDAIGKSSTLEQLNKPFELQIKTLTSQAVGLGVLNQNQIQDPDAIADGIEKLRQDNQDLEKRNDQIVAQQGRLRDPTINRTEGERAQNQRESAALETERRNNLTQIRDNTNAMQRSKDALEQMASSGDLASNALKKFEESQRKVAAAASFAQNVFTSSAQDNFKRAGEIAVAREALGGNREVLQTQFGRQAAFSGLQQFEGMLDPAEYRSLQADLLEQNFLATGQDLNAQAGPTGKTWQEILDQMRNPEESPEAKAFRDATEKAAQANIRLGLLELQNSERIADEIVTLQDIMNDFPSALEEAMIKALATQAAEDQRTEQEKKKEEADKEVAAAEQDVAALGPTIEQAKQNIEDEEEKIRQQTETRTAAQRELDDLNKLIADREKEQYGEALGPTEFQKETEKLRTRRAPLEKIIEENKGDNGVGITRARQQLIDAERRQKLDYTPEEQAKIDRLEKAKQKQAEAQADVDSQQQDQRIAELDRGANERRQARALAAAERKRNRDRMATDQSSRIEQLKQDAGLVEQPEELQPPQQPPQQRPQQPLPPTVNPFTGDLVADEDIFADQPTPSTYSTRQEENRALVGTVRRDTTPTSSSAETDAARIGEIFGPAARAQRERDERILANPGQYDANTVRQAEQRQRDNEFYDGIAESYRQRNQTQGSAPSSVSQAGVTASTEVQARQQEAPKPPPPTAYDRVNSTISGLTERRETTGRLNPFQVRELELARREKRKLERLGQTATNVVPSATTTDVSQGVATTNVSQQTEQQATQQPQQQESLATAVASFGEYVNQLISFEFPRIPETITLEANHNVNVTFQGGAVFQALDSRMSEMAIAETDRAMGELWNQSNGQYGRRPSPPTNGGGGTATG